MLCKICDSELIFNFKLNEKYEYYKCSACNLLTRVPDSLNIDYQNDYTNIEIISKPRNLSKKYYSLFSSIIREGASVLELGGSFGFFCQYLNNRKFCNCINIEPSKIASEYSQKLGVETYDNIDSVKGQLFDFIVTFHVLEHIEPAHIKDLFQKLYSMLKTGGQFLIITPNAESIRFKKLRNKFEWLSPEEHISFFSAKTMRKLIEAHQACDIQIYSAIPAFTHFPHTTFIEKLRRKYLPTQVQIIKYNDQEKIKNLKSSLKQILKNCFHGFSFFEKCFYFPFYFFYESLSKEKDELVVIIKK
ncbi:MAG: class I SAM-dependent methyltransferase [Candidatus Kapabacteria bacterium]|nr:class I SAM-dependent methyltransferase [Candidatus Kapabacteria bacterium]